MKVTILSITKGPNKSYVAIHIEGMGDGVVMASIDTAMVTSDGIRPKDWFGRVDPDGSCITFLVVDTSNLSNRIAVGDTLGLPKGDI